MNYTKLAQFMYVSVKKYKIIKMSEIDNIISTAIEKAMEKYFTPLVINKIDNIISTAIQKAVEKYIAPLVINNTPLVIKGVGDICDYLQISRNTFLSLYHKGEYGRAVTQKGRMFYLCPIRLFE